MCDPGERLRALHSTEMESARSFERGTADASIYIAFKPFFGTDTTHIPAKRDFLQ